MSTLREQDHHYHARSRYQKTGLKDFFNLLEDIKAVKEKKGLSLNVHLPFEIQHPDVYPEVLRGLFFIVYGELLKKTTGVALYWENSPEQDFGKWTLRTQTGQTQWHLIPQNIDLTLDTGHLMLGAKSIEEARERIEGVLFARGSQIKHLHLHENDLVHDDHSPIGKIITPDLFRKLTTARTYIFEKDEILSLPRIFPDLD